MPVLIKQQPLYGGSQYGAIPVGQQIIFTIASPLTVKLSGGTSTIVPHKIDNEIVSLILPSSKTLVKGEKLLVKDKSFRINYLKGTIEGAKILDGIDGSGWIDYIIL